MKLLDGQVVENDDARDVLIAELQDEIRQLRAEVQTSQAAITKAQREANRATGELRRQLAPLYRALQAVFGELDALGADETSSIGVGNPRASAIWESWKARLGGQCAKVIEALMLQPGMNTTQLAIAIGTHRNNIPNLIFKLNKAGLLDKNGGRFSLKAL